YSRFAADPVCPAVRVLKPDNRPYGQAGKGYTVLLTTKSSIGQGDDMPLATSLGNTEVRLGERRLPLLYASDTQINAQLPDVPVNTELQLVVRRGAALSVPLPVTVEAQPAIFTVDQSGEGQAAIVDGGINAQNGSESPAHGGDSVVIYCTGLGAVN